MNDFTKEELEIIASYLAWTHDKHKDLIDKILGMIDNYCEHEFQIKSLRPHFLMMCEKCNKTFVDGSFSG